MKQPQAPTNTDLDDWRSRVRSIDNSIAELIQKRSDCVLEIGRRKDEHGIGVFDPQQEMRLLRQYVLSRPSHWSIKGSYYFWRQLHLCSLMQQNSSVFSAIHTDIQKRMLVETNFQLGAIMPTVDFTHWNEIDQESKPNPIIVAVPLHYALTHQDWRSQWHIYTILPIDFPKLISNLSVNSDNIDHHGPDGLQSISIPCRADMVALMCKVPLTEPLYHIRFHASLAGKSKSNVDDLTIWLDPDRATTSTGFIGGGVMFPPQMES